MIGVGVGAGVGVGGRDVANEEATTNSDGETAYSDFVKKVYKMDVLGICLKEIGMVSRGKLFRLQTCVPESKRK